MRQKLLASAAIIVGAALAMPAVAEITVNGTVRYDKVVAQVETLTKAKTVVLTVTVVVNGETAAESNAITNQRIGAVPAVAPVPGLAGSQGHAGNAAANTHEYESVGIFSGRLGADFVALVANSVNNNVGITQFNQDVGAGSNQANLVSAAVGAFAFFAEANAATAQHVEGNSILERGRVIGTNGSSTVQPVRVASMSGSVNRNTGITMVNQNAGVFNNQTNSAALALGFGPGNVALAESDLGQWNTGNLTREYNVARSASIANSGNFNTGVVAGNQAAGSFANQANMLSVSATLGGTPSQFTTFAGAVVPNF